MYWSIVILALIGIGDTAYLIHKASKKEKLSCPLGSDCNTVLNSKWSTTLGVRNDLLGLLYYLGVLLGTLGIIYALPFAALIKSGLLLASAGAFFLSGYLTYVQIKNLDHICFYCLISAIVSTLIFIFLTQTL